MPCLATSKRKPGVVQFRPQRNRIHYVAQTDEKRTHKPGPKKFHVQISDRGNRYFGYTLQAIEFPSGRVFVAYDAWRILSRDVSSDDETNRWFSSIEELQKHSGYRILGNASEASYTRIIQKKM